MTGSASIPNPPDARFDVTDHRAWITPAKSVDVPPHVRSEAMPYFAIAPSAPIVPQALPRDEWVAARLAELRAPLVARLRTAEVAALDQQRGTDICEKDFEQHPSKDSHARLSVARQELLGALDDLEIVKRQIVLADAEQAAIDWRARYAAYLDGIEQQRTYAAKLVEAEAAASEFAKCYAQLRAADPGRSDTKRRLRDALIRGWISQGYHPEDLIAFVRF